MGCHVSLQVHPHPMSTDETEIVEVPLKKEVVKAESITLEDFVPSLDEISISSINM